MNITVQYPITDCRLFLHKSGKLRKPYFVSPDTEGREYIRHFGAMQGRHFQEYYYCVGENTFCNARHALRFSRPPSFYKDQIACLKRCANRFYSDGGILGKFEVKSAYRIQPDRLNPENGSAYRQLLDFHFGHEVRINDAKGGNVRASFSDAGPALAKLYLYGSTACGSLHEIRKYWVQSGQSIVIVEEHAKRASDFRRLPAGATEVLLKDQWSAQYLRLYRYTYDGIPCWIIEILSNAPEAKKMCRNLKTLLLRIHAEKQSVIKALEFLSINKDNEAVDIRKATHFIKNTLVKLQKDRRFDLKQSDIVNIAFEADDSFSQDDYRRLRQAVLDLNNRYIIEDFDCIFAQIDFDALCEAYSPEAKKMCRNLKTLLLRIHAEKQSVIKALEFLSINKDNEAVDIRKATHFIKNTLVKLQKDRRFDLKQSDIVNIAFEADDSFSQDDYRRLRQAVLDLNNRYIIEDFDCIFAQIDFDALCEAYYCQINEDEDEIPEAIRAPLEEVVHSRSKLKFKQFSKRYRSILEGCASSALFEIIKYGAVSVIGGI